MRENKKIKPHTYHDSNSSWDENISGKIKFNNDQSSAKLFWRGVPVNRILFSTGMYFNCCTNLHLEFFNLCPFNKQMQDGLIHDIVTVYKRKTRNYSLHQPRDISSCSVLNIFLHQPTPLHMK